MSSTDKIIYPEIYLNLKRQQEQKDRLDQFKPLNSNQITSNQLSSSVNHNKSPKINYQSNHTSNQIHSNQLNHSINSTSHPHHSQQTKFNQSYESTNLDEESTYLNQSERSSFVSLDDEVINTNPKFIQDCSQYWYRPTISREDAIRILLNKPSGSFIVRDSESFKGAFGLAIRVSQTIADAQRKSYGKGQSELVRHFLIEPTSKGVRIKGCANEPTFSSLSALIYQHTTTQLALPCKLILPEIEPIQTLSIREPSLANQLQHNQLMSSGAACKFVKFIEFKLD